MRICKSWCRVFLLVALSLLREAMAWQGGSAAAADGASTSEPEPGELRAAGNPPSPGYGVTERTHERATGSRPEPGDLRTVGRIEFPISGAAAVRPEFERGVALLHSFFYEEARRIFTGVAEKDPNCAMAQWGIAMTWWHPIWTPPTAEEMAAGRAAIDRATEMIRLRPSYGATQGGTTMATDKE